MNHVHNQRNTGFTLIELMLAMTFISVLLLAIALSIIQIGNIYNKGITIKEINQASRAIADDLSRSASEAQALTLPDNLRSNAVSGRLCFGNYSYIWNTTEGIEQKSPNLMRYEDDNAKELRLVKIADSSKIYCAVDSNNVLVHSRIRAVDADRAQELLPGGDHKLGVNALTLPVESRVVDGTTKQSMYTLYFTLGSGKVQAMTDDRTACRGPNDPASDLIYCSVQQFTLVIRTGNRVK